MTHTHRFSVSTHSTHETETNPLLICSHPFGLGVLVAESRDSFFARKETLTTTQHVQSYHWSRCVKQTTVISVEGSFIVLDLRILYLPTRQSCFCSHVPHVAQDGRLRRSHAVGRQLPTCKSQFLFHRCSWSVGWIECMRSGVSSGTKALI